MRFHEPFDDFFRTRTRVRILRFLFLNPEVPSTGREIARKLHVAHSNVTVALSRLVQTGILRSLAKGRSILYRPNPQHVVVPELREIFQRERNLLGRALKGLPIEWSSLTRSVIVYGSVARREELLDSDVDLCLVARGQTSRKLLEGKMEGLQSEFYLRTGNRFSPWVISAARFVERYRKSDPLIRRIAREGRVIVGDSMAELLT
jgi:DNA-binding transcriptional ArsR family regulator